MSPLGAGDLIDRSVRFYRKNFWTFLFIGSPPVIVGTIFLVGWTLLGRTLFVVSQSDPMEATLYQVFIFFGDMFIWLVQIIAILVVMGGASRNFVRHILFSEPITFRETYRNVRSRFAGLTGISVLLTAFLGFVGLVIFYITLTIAILAIAAAAVVLQYVPLLMFLVGVAIALGTVAGGLWLFFLLASRFVYVPQVMLVEGQGAFAAVGRSASLASKNVKRVMALCVFTLVASYSALSLLAVPLSIYAWNEGVQFFSFDAVDTYPAWYEISYQVISQASLILIVPVLMIGLCLLYVDERVKGEGYDLELLAAARLGDIPSVPAEFINPLQPALAENTAPSGAAAPGAHDRSTLGLG